MKERILRCGSAGEELVSLVSLHCAEFTLDEVAAAFRKLLADNEQLLLVDKAQRSSRGERSGGGREVEHSGLRRGVEEAACALEEAYVKMLPSAGAREACEALRAIAKAQYQPANSSLLGMLEQRAEHTAGEAAARDLANCLWAFATLQRKPPARLLTLLEVRIEQTAANAAPADIGDTLWAYASLDCSPGRPVLAALEKSMLDTVALFQPQVRVGACVV